MRSLLSARLQRQRPVDQRRRYLPDALPAVCDLAAPDARSRSGRAPRCSRTRRRRAFWMQTAPERTPHLAVSSRACRCSSRRSISPPSATCVCGTGRMAAWTTSRGSWRSLPHRSWRRFPPRSFTWCCGAARRRRPRSCSPWPMRFGTTTWVISSQALWQHGMAQLLLIGALLFLTAPCTDAAGACGGAAVRADRRQPSTGCASSRRRWERTGCSGPAAGRRSHGRGGRAADGLGASLQSRRGRAHSRAVPTGGPATASSFGTTCSPASPDCSSARHAGCSSSLRSCSFSSWPGGTRRAIAATRPRARDGAGVVVQVVALSPDRLAGRHLVGAAFPDRHAAAADVAAGAGGRRARAAPAGRASWPAVGVAVAIEAIGAFCYTGATDSAVFAVASGPHQMRAAWDWRNAPFIASLAAWSSRRQSC